MLSDLSVQIPSNSVCRIDRKHFSTSVALFWAGNVGYKIECVWCASSQHICSQQNKSNTFEWFWSTIANIDNSFDAFLLQYISFNLFDLFFVLLWREKVHACESVYYFVVFGWKCYDGRPHGIIGRNQIYRIFSFGVKTYWCMSENKCGVESCRNTIVKSTKTKMFLSLI